MGDSDEEFDSRRSGREKFQRERPTDSGSRDRRGSRDNWDNADRNKTRSDGPWNRGRDSENPREHRRQRDRYSQSPPQKRARRDWDDRENGGGGGGGGGYGGGGRGGHDRSYSVGDRGYGQPAGGNWGGGGSDLRQHIPQPHPAAFAAHANRPFNRQPIPEPEYPCQPPMTPFKQFLSTQDDSISEEEAVKRYNQYKLDFKKSQLNEYFLAHKHEEWFKMKYHPEDGGKRKTELRGNLQSRVDAFVKLLEMGRIDGTPIDVDNIDPLVRLLDSAVVLMEGGGEEDLERLAKLAEEEAEEEEGEVDSKSKGTLAGLIDSSVKSTTSKSGTAPTPKSPTLTKKDKKRAKKQAKKLKKARRKKKRKHSDDDDDDDSGSDSSSSSSDSSSSSSSSSDSDDEDEDDTDLEEGEEKDEKVSDAAGADAAANGPGKENGEADGAKEEADSITLHRTQSVFIRNLAPNITKQEVEAMCTKYPGFMRVALQDPQSERKFFRRGWVTFNKSVNIKDICWNLNNIRLRDCELRAIVNRDLKQRVRPVSGLVNHKQAIKAYIKLAAKIIQNIDTRWSTWKADKDSKDEAGEKEKEKSFGLVSQNPVMKGITDYLVDEASMEDELLGDDGEITESNKNDKTELAIEKDDKMIAVLDRMVWYLRIVYSIDFYNGIEYPNEHEMPHRCGIVHARGVVPAKLPNQSELNEFISHFETKVKQFTDERRMLSDAECLKLGKKDAESEVEKFISTNTQELAKDKWLCPLSGKKFKGPEFVRKHIMSKHNEKIDEVKTEAMYFNAYLEDAKRPQLPEHPSNSTKSVAPPRRPLPGDMGPPQGLPGFGGHMMGHPPYGGNFRGGFRGGFDHYGGGGGGRGYGPRPDPYNNRDSFRRPPMGHNRFNSGGRRDGRSLIQYTDLDAPDDDIF